MLCKSTRTAVKDGSPRLCQNMHMRRYATLFMHSQLRYVVESLTAHNELAHESDPLAKQALPEGALLRYG